MDSFSSFIDQSLVDNTSTDADKAGMNSGSEYGNELFYQLLLSAVNSPNQPNPLATINPNSLSAAGAAMDSASGYADLAGSVAGDPNAFLTAALLSALDPLASTDVNNTMLQGDTAMLVDTPESAGSKAEASSEVAASKASARPAVVAAAASKPAAASAKKQTIQQQALSTTASKRNGGNTNGASSAASAAGAAQKTHQNTTTATSRRATTPAATSLATRGPLAAASEDANDDIDMEGIDLKSLSSKERRQLRNKISARNFRVRRKEYISTLEAEVRVIKEENDSLRAELAESKKDNVQLRDELNKLRHRINQLSVSQHTTAVGTASTLASAGRAVMGSTAQQQHQHQQQSLLTRPPSNAVSSPANGISPALAAQSAATATATATAAVSTPAPAKPLATSAQTMAAMPRFNPHKDIGQAAAKKGSASANGSSSAAGGNWASKSSQTGFIAVNTAVMPPSHVAAADQLVLDMRRQQSVDALLDIQNMPEQQQQQQQLDADADPALVLAALEAGGLIAELLISQVAIEASLALAHPPAAALSFVAGACS
ncbi:hypothetical protein LPJ56_001922 [Coemansia sp. RSA 2599]|nr:hypothetical protein LPJ75_001546 [Coemansia sp. RSA 2598]KAJ1826954.1 hypothetical protein LPJ56_001922 [Coemansia sp. RSA 2599]